MKNDPFIKSNHNVTNFSKGNVFRVKSTTASLPLSCYTLSYDNSFYNVPNSSVSYTLFGFVLRDPPPAPERNLYYAASHMGSYFKYAVYSESHASLYIDNGWSGVGFDINNGVVTGSAGDSGGSIGFTATGNVSVTNGVLNITASNPQTSDGSGRDSVWSSSFNASIPMPLTYWHNFMPECNPWSIELSGSNLNITDNNPTNVTVIPSESDRYWVLTVTGTGGYSMSYRDLGSKTISIPDGVSLPNSTASYTAEVHYEERTGTNATATFVFVPPNDPPSPTPDPTVKPTTTPTVSPTPTSTPTPVCPDGGTEMLGIKDMEGKPVCCPAYAHCDIFGGTKKNPSDNPSAGPSSNPSSNPTTNPSVNPSSNPTANPTTNPSSSPNGTGDGSNKKSGFLLLENGKEIVSTIVNTKFSVLVANVESTDAWMLKRTGSDLVLASGIGPQVVDINSADLNRGLPDGTYLDDGYYDLYLDINPEAKVSLGVDNTPPEFVIDYEKSYFDANDYLVTYGNFVDPVVNGVSSGVSEAVQKADDIYLSSTNGTIDFHKSLDFDGYFKSSLPPIPSSNADQVSVAANNFWIAGFSQGKIIQSRMKFRAALSNLHFDGKANSISAPADKVKNEIDGKNLCKN